MLANVVTQCLAILGIIFTGSGEKSVKVTQLPESVNTNTGTNVSFHCSVPLFQDGPRVNVYWWKKGDNQYLTTGQNDRKVIGFKTKFSGFLQIINVRVQDAGIYYCTVTHRSKTVGNGTGSNLSVGVPPTPLKINTQQLEKDSSAPLTVLCATSPFSPENISFTWYKYGKKTITGISTIIKLNTNGLYEASSRLQETRPVRTTTVYTCLVSHSALQISAIATHIFTNPNKGAQITSFLLISASAGGGFVLLVLGLFIAKRCVTKKNHGEQKNGEKSDYPVLQSIQGDAEMLALYAALDTTNSQKAPRPKRQDSTVYMEAKQRLPDTQLTYAALDMTGPKKTVKPHYKDKSTEYAQLKVGKQIIDIMYTEPRAT